MSVVFHLTGRTESEEVITTENSEANAANLMIAILPAPQGDGSAPQDDLFSASKVPMMTTIPNSKEQFTGIV